MRIFRENLLLLLLLLLSLDLHKDKRPATVKMIFHKRGKPETPRRITLWGIGESEACASREPLMQPPRNGQLSRVMQSTSLPVSQPSQRSQPVEAAFDQRGVRGTCHRSRLHFESRCQVMAAPFGAGIRSCKPKKEKSGRPRIASSKKEKLTARKRPADR